MRLLKFLIILTALGLAALAGFAFLGDMSADREPVAVEVPLDTNSAPAPAASADSPDGTVSE